LLFGAFRKRRGDNELNQVEAAATRFEGRPPGEVLAWVAAEYRGRVVFTTGFGAEGCVLVDLIASDRLAIDIVTLDTGLLFPETYALWRRLEDRYGVTIRGVLPEQSVAEQAAAHGERLWGREPDACCQLRKILPLEKALRGQGAWITAIRRDQTADRAVARVVETDPREASRIKVNPLAGWTSADVWAHVRRNEVPVNPLHERGYPSIGCWPCTSPVAVGEDARAGRWRNQPKTECGLHGRAAQWRPEVHLNRP
jgi:phosphoadenylyl-sulfate reductase (thioredoxin)